MKKLNTYPDREGIETLWWGDESVTCAVVEYLPRPRGD